MSPDPCAHLSVRGLGVEQCVRFRLRVAVRVTRLVPERGREPSAPRGADDRGEPVIQLSPPLIAGPDQFGEIVDILRQGLTEAMAELEM